MMDQILEAVVPHGGRIEAIGSHLLFCDTAAHDWQLIRVPTPELYRHRVRLAVTILPCGETKNFIYFAHIGGIHLGYVNLTTGEVVQGQAEEISCEKFGASFKIDVLYELNDDAVLLGSAMNSSNPIYSGDGSPQFVIQEFSVRPARYPSGTRPNLTLVDIGAADGLQPKWDRYAADLSVIFVEPEPEAARRLDEQTCHIERKTILTHPLYKDEEERELNITMFEQCSSLLEPDMAVLANWKVAPLFEIKHRVAVQCRRYDSIHVEQSLPTPDFIKVDVQGAELDVLKGFGGLLHDCLGIELEAHFYPVYKNQSLILDLVQYLYSFGLFLRDIRPCRSFDNDYVEVDAYFTRRLRDSDPPEAAAKIAFIETVLELKHYSYGQNLAASFLG